MREEFPGSTGAGAAPEGRIAYVCLIRIPNQPQARPTPGQERTFTMPLFILIIIVLLVLLLRGCSL